jgi:hypothetical protein
MDRHPPPATGHPPSATCHPHRQAPGPPGRYRQVDQPSQPQAFIHSGHAHAGVAPQDVQEATSHADPRTTMRYDRGRGSPNRHATYIVAAFLAGASRQIPLDRASPPATLGPAGHRTPSGGAPPIWGVTIYRGDC